MRRNCTECRHWSLSIDQHGCDSGMWCAKNHWKLEDFILLDDGYRRALRTATDCPEYEPVESEGELRLGSQYELRADGIYKDGAFQPQMDPAVVFGPEWKKLAGAVAVEGGQLGTLAKI